MAGQRSNQLNYVPTRQINEMRNRQCLCGFALIVYIARLIANINTLEGYNLTLPTSYAWPNYIYAISISTSERSASLITYNDNLTPTST